MKNDAIFRGLRQGSGVLRLANCWDPGSARLIESLGAPAVATTSAGVAWARAYPDGDALPVDELVTTVAAIARAIRVPLTVDIEGGYSEDPSAVGEVVRRFAEAGAVGINIEDGSAPPDMLCAKIAAAKRGAARAGVDLFVNARTDVFLAGLAAEGEVEEVLVRGARYRDAGADGLFVPGLVEPDQIRTVARATDLPLNVLAWPGLAPADELAALGVRRLSAGAAIAQVLWARASTLARAFLADGRSDPFFEGQMSYGALNAMTAPR